MKCVVNYLPRTKEEAMAQLSSYPSVFKRSPVGIDFPPYSAQQVPIGISKETSRWEAKGIDGGPSAKSWQVPPALSWAMPVWNRSAVAAVGGRVQRPRGFSGHPRSGPKGRRGGCYSTRIKA